MSNPQYHFLGLFVKRSDQSGGVLLRVSLAGRDSFVGRDRYENVMRAHFLYYSRCIRRIFMVCIFRELRREDCGARGEVRSWVWEVL
jgi:hypothetical protein